MAIKSNVTPEKPLFSNIKDVKAFLLWAKAEGVLSIKVAGIEAIFNPNLAHANVPGLELVPETRTPEQIAAALKKEEDDILFHSVR